MRHQGGCRQNLDVMGSLGGLFGDRAGIVRVSVGDRSGIVRDVVARRPQLVYASTRNTFIILLEIFYT